LTLDYVALLTISIARIVWRLNFELCFWGWERREPKVKCGEFMILRPIPPVAKVAQVSTFCRCSR
jgi:hypothetical protein